MKSPVNLIFVRCKDIYEYYVKHGSLELYVDPLFKKRKVISGIVEVIPDRLDYGFDRIVPEVQVGDLLYFHYNSLDEDSVIPGTQGLYTIPYDQAFCSVRNGEIIMIGGRVLCLPWYDPNVKNIDVDGNKVKARVTNSGIITEINIGHDLQKSVLAHIGTPLIGDPVLPVQKGDEVYYIKDGDFENTIEGVTYFCMFQEDLLMAETKKQNE